MLNKQSKKATQSITIHGGDGLIGLNYPPSPGLFLGFFVLLYSMSVTYYSADPTNTYNAHVRAYARTHEMSKDPYTLSTNQNL